MSQGPATTAAAKGFDDLLEANRRYAIAAPRMVDRSTHAGIAVVTCMDARLQPLAILGLVLGEAEILRTPGGRLTRDAEQGCRLAVEMLAVDRILILTHSRCEFSGSDQRSRLEADVRGLARDPDLAGRAEAGGFHYDIETGLLRRIC